MILLLIGRLMKTSRLLTRDGIDDLKALVTRLILPAAIFNALATAEYHATLLILVGIMFGMLLLSFALGFLIKPLMEPRFRKYLPFMVSVYEGGLIAYPLYTSLCGSEHLSKIALLDIASLLFGFSVYMGLLQQIQTGEKIDGKALFASAWKSPVFLATVCGVLVGLSGVMNFFLKTPAGAIYTGTLELLTAGMTAMILFVVGYDLSPDRRMVLVCLKTVCLRFGMQVIMAALVLTAVHYLLPEDPLLKPAIILYMAAPATFSMQSFMKNEESSAYVSTTNSLYVLVSIAVYVALAICING